MGMQELRAKKWEEVKEQSKGGVKKFIAGREAELKQKMGVRKLKNELGRAKKIEQRGRTKQRRQVRRQVEADRGRRSRRMKQEELKEWKVKEVNKIGWRRGVRTEDQRRGTER